MSDGLHLETDRLTMDASSMRQMLDQNQVDVIKTTAWNVVTDHEHDSAGQQLSAVDGELRLIFGRSEPVWLQSGELQFGATMDDTTPIGVTADGDTLSIELKGSDYSHD